MPRDGPPTAVLAHSLIYAAIEIDDPSRDGRGTEPDLSRESAVPH